MRRLDRLEVRFGGVGLLLGRGRGSHGGVLLRLRQARLAADLGKTRGFALPGGRGTLEVRDDALLASHDDVGERHGARDVGLRGEHLDGEGEVTQATGLEGVARETTDLRPSGRLIGAVAGERLE